MQEIATITSGDDIFFYFEIIKQLQPQSMLDVGMFLKRIGAISRQAMSMEISQDMFMYGIDFFPEVNLPIYNQVYNGILPKQIFMANSEVIKNDKSLHFDIAVLLSVDGLLDETEMGRLAACLNVMVDGILTDEVTGKKILACGVGGTYQSLNVGDSQYMWIPLAGREGVA